MPQTNHVEYYDQLDRLQFDYPPYESPFTIRINRNYSKWMINYCNEWIKDNLRINTKENHYRMIVDNSDLSLYSACCFPTANFHRLEKLMKWCTLYFLVDDFNDIPDSHDNGNNNNGHGCCRNFWQQMIDMYDGILTDYQCDKWPNLIKTIRQVMKETYFDYNQQQIIRSIKMFKDYIGGNLLENEWSSSSENNGIPKWNDYMKARLGSVGGQMTLQLIEYAKNIQLNDNEWNHSLMKLLQQTVSEQMILINDYLTFRKEVAEANYKFSQMKHSFTILVKHNGLTLQEAVNHVHRCIGEKDEEIFTLIEQITKNKELNCNSDASERIQTYLNGIKEVLGGYWRYAMQSKRYHGHDFQHQAIPSSGHFIYDRNVTIISNEKPINYRWLENWHLPDNVQPD